MCNPPFYGSAEEVERSAEGKAMEPSAVRSNTHFTSSFDADVDTLVIVFRYALAQKLK